MKLKYKIRRQPPIKGGRIPHGAGLERRLEYEIQHAARKFNVSIPFVISTALADYFGIDLGREERADYIRKIK